MDPAAAKKKPAKKKPKAQPLPEGFGAKNTILTTAEAEAIKAEMREMFQGKLNTAVSSDFGAKNKGISLDDMEVLKARMRDKFKGKLNTLDPEMMEMGPKMTIYYVESGVRKFADLARQLAEDFGVSLRALKPYLRGWYVTAQFAREDAGEDVSDLDDADTLKGTLATLIAAEEQRMEQPRQ
ncbi:MAG: hypothetical protein IID58_12320, partial [Proteobacteria bacterium]|nr:hypothetical protein [Pseudomonadota bacterium]